MPYLGNELATQFQAFVTQTITGDGSTGYTLDRAVANGKELLVYINNVKQEEGSGKSYTATGTTITFSAAVASTDSCYVVFLGSAVQTVNPPDASIGSSQITNATLVMPNKLDMNGNELILDADADTSITADTDDQIDIKIAGSDSLRIKANEIENVSGDLLIDTVGSTIIDSDGDGEVVLKDGGTQYGQFFKDGNDLKIVSSIQDGDIVLRGNDGGSGVNALTVDMSQLGGVLINPSTRNNETSASANMVVTSGGSFAFSTSSRRYKNTINDATHGLAELLKLRSVTYKGNNTYNDGDTIFGGLIAEEVHDAGLTEFVVYDDQNKPESLHYGHMVALCVKSIQELKTELDDAKARIATLESK